MHVLRISVTPTVPAHLAASVVQRVDSIIHWINHYPLDNALGFGSTYPIGDSNLSAG